MAKKSVSRRMSPSSNLPTGVRVIAIFNYVVAVIAILSGLFFLAGAAFFSSDVSSAFLQDFIGSTTLANKIIAIASGVVGVIGIILAVLFFFMARGLWKGKNWARILTIIFAVLWFIGSLADILRGDWSGDVPTLVVGGIIGWYLLFNKNVQRAFAR